MNTEQAYKAALKAAVSEGDKELSKLLSRRIDDIYKNKPCGHAELQLDFGREFYNRLTGGA